GDRPGLGDRRHPSHRSRVPVAGITFRWAGTVSDQPADAAGGNPPEPRGLGRHPANGEAIRSAGLALRGPHARRHAAVCRRRQTTVKCASVGVRATPLIGRRSWGHAEKAMIRSILARRAMYWPAAQTGGWNDTYRPPATGMFMKRLSGEGISGGTSPSSRKAATRLSVQLSWYSRQPRSSYRYRSHAAMRVSWIPGVVSPITWSTGRLRLVTKTSPASGMIFSIAARLCSIDMNS